MKNVTAFCPCLKSLPEAKVKCFGLIPLKEEISKQFSADSVMWSLVLTLIKIYGEKKQASQGEIFEKERSARKWNGAKSHVEGHEQGKNCIKGAVTPGQDCPQIGFQL